MRYFLALIILCSFNAFAQRPATQLARLQHAPDAEKIKLYLNISKAYMQDQPDSAVHYANLGVKLSEQKNDRESLAAFLEQLGLVNALHNHKELARSFFNEALNIFRRLHDVSGIARTYDQLGVLDKDEKDIGRAMQYYRDTRDSSGVIASYEAMGKLNEEKGNFDKAISYYSRALAQYENRKKEPEAYFQLLENIGQLYLKKGDTKTAMHYLEEGISKSRRQASRDTEVHLLNTDGKALEQAHDENKALNTYKQALSEAKKYHEADEQAEALISIAGILKKQDAATSISDLKQALSIAENLKEPKLQARIFAALAGVYRQQKNYNEAIAALEEQHRLVDSLLNADTVKDIAALDSSYALESSREKVGTLEKVNRIEGRELLFGIIALIAVIIALILLWVYLRKVKKLNEELRASNQVKDTLFSVIGHDLKGPAGSAAQLFEMMETEDFTEAEMKGMIAELRKQTTASLELLKALFEWGKAQLQGIKVNPTDFSAKPVVERSITLLSQQAAQKHIDIRDNIPNYVALKADADHFEFIIRNLISNAIKFSYQGGAIEIDAQMPAKKKEIIFSVKDTGIGISKDQQSVFLTSNLKVNFGTNKEKGSGLGLMLTKDFVKANNGRIWLESEEGNGTTFYIAMPSA
ncbi:tetratricopeptide repeat-containing sensor histidine kinase [Mucilaginibacter sp. KACC 22063]|uniref:tetratricopeptide repeat-containing sensor histidine kinase n=1 Tax=Mucilaginibacter sp. KACC 22063 TaxID=3025666 RepID=UPI002366BA04|nr:tetratricopeptide repeat protein [Mucilaginibacter sp. KACC 22063]WDF53335.1 tetratricopeptide repeat protein [Mucilaginibacter sp. KACC 22063]